MVRKYDPGTICVGHTGPRHGHQPVTATTRTDDHVETAMTSTDREFGFATIPRTLLSFLL